MRRISISSEIDLRRGRRRRTAEWRAEERSSDLIDRSLMEQDVDDEQ